MSYKPDDFFVAMSEVEHYEADSKFFRSVAVSIYALMVINLWLRSPSAAGATSIAWAVVIAATVAPIWLLAAKLFFANWTRVKLATFALLLITVLLLSLVRRDWQSVVLVTFFVLSAWRYGERRWKSTRSAYSYTIILYDQDPPDEPVKAPGITPASAAAAVTVGTVQAASSAQP